MSSFANQVKKNTLTFQTPSKKSKNYGWDDLKYPDNQRQTFERQGRAPASNSQKNNQSRSRSKSHNKKHHFNNN